MGDGEQKLIIRKALANESRRDRVPDAYRQEEFARRKQVKPGDFATWIVSREDLVLSKIFWARNSRSEMQLNDVRNLLSADCDIQYLRSRAKTLGVNEMLEELLVNE